VLFLAAGDEVYAQTGIKRFLTHGEAIAQGVFGEPTEHVPIIQHNGTVRWDITVRGKSAHTAKPELGVNAIYGMVEVIQAIRQYEQDLRDRYSNPLITPPTLTVTRIQGGRTRNAVADECTIAVDFRIHPGMDPAEARQEMMDALSRLPHGIHHDETQLMTPPLATRADDPFARSVLASCQKVIGKPMDLAGVPYGTDASWLPAPSVVLGPGNIASAHAIDENIRISEVVEAAQIYRQIMLTDYAAIQ
jgi:acetylornithine deacetylase